ncbi:MAG: hypothetical protein CME32_11505 [Gimesia sp.]|nr:hypothetical protein [Gimesia sp.]
MNIILIFLKVLFKLILKSETTKELDRSIRHLTTPTSLFLLKNYKNWATQTGMAQTLVSTVIKIVLDHFRFTKALNSAVFNKSLDALVPFIIIEDFFVLVLQVDLLNVHGGSSI